MFDSPGPHVFALPPGADFPVAVAGGLARRLATAPPEAWARVTLFANSGRMARRLHAALSDGGSRLLPRIRTVADLAEDAGFPQIPEARTGLDLTLDLACLVQRLIDADPTLAPKSATFDLAESLAALLDEMHGEGVGAQALADLDVGPHAHHWARSRAIVQAAFDHFAAPSGSDTLLAGTEARRAAIIDVLIDRWAMTPPPNPVLVVGSTGSRGATRRLMAAVARLPQGAVILPGYDFDQPPEIWDRLDSALTGEDHPQFRFRALMSDLGIGPADVLPWCPRTAPDPGRNKLISLALRPAPVTDAWLSEGPSLGDPGALTKDMSLIEAPSPRAEATAIALRLRQAVAEGQTAAIVSPDRVLTRRVAAALDRWGIHPDDSAGVPLDLTPPGRLLRQIADWRQRGPTLPALIALLKHPLTASGGGRGDHLRHSRDAELYLRGKRIPHPDPAILARWAKDDAQRLAWTSWVSETLFAPSDAGTLLERVEDIVATAERLCDGPAPEGISGLWQAAAGEEARRVIDRLLDAAPAAPPVNDADTARLLASQLAQGQARDPRIAHPQVMIWGTIEARGMGADLVVLAGLNEGTWPGAPAADPWLNRVMRAEAGLLLPDRRIGLSAHDFQQAVAARHVVLSRARLDNGAQTVPARWLNRLTNLLEGLGDDGARALTAMRARGTLLLAQAAALEAPAPDEIQPRAPRPAPQPPVAMRPRELSVTSVTTLRRDAYAIYARRILGLYPLQPLHPVPDGLDKGIALHKVMETFLKDRRFWLEEPEEVAIAALDQAAEEQLRRAVADPAQRAFWLARFARVAARLVTGEHNRLALGEPMIMEDPGGLLLGRVPFRLTARPDRIDRRQDGSLAVFDYKSGSPPSVAMVDTLDRQLPLTAALIERGGFAEVKTNPVKGPVEHMAYIGLGASAPEESVIKIDHKDGGRRPDIAWDDLIALIQRFDRRETGYGARLAVHSDNFAGDYDHLARFGEWTHAQRATLIQVGPPGDEEAAP